MRAEPTLLSTAIWRNRGEGVAYTERAYLRSLYASLVTDDAALRAELARVPGLLPEAREAYLEFTQALRSHFPVFQNTNMLYHELKGHYFLYLSKHGDWDTLRDQVLERERDEHAKMGLSSMKTRSCALPTR